MKKTIHIHELMRQPMKQVEGLTRDEVDLLALAGSVSLIVETCPQIDGLYDQFPTDLDLIGKRSEAVVDRVLSSAIRDSVKEERTKAT